MKNILNPITFRNNSPSLSEGWEDKIQSLINTMNEMLWAESMDIKPVIPFEIPNYEICHFIQNLPTNIKRQLPEIFSLRFSPQE